jgi:hypothetical protein
MLHLPRNLLPSGGVSPCATSATRYSSWPLEDHSFRQPGRRHPPPLPGGLTARRAPVPGALTRTGLHFRRVPSRRPTTRRASRSIPVGMSAHAKDCRDLSRAPATRIRYPRIFPRPPIARRQCPAHGPSTWARPIARCSSAAGCSSDRADVALRFGTSRCGGRDRTLRAYPAYLVPALASSSCRGRSPGAWRGRRSGARAGVTGVMASSSARRRRRRSRAPDDLQRQGLPRRAQGDGSRASHGRSRNAIRMSS